MSVWQQCVPLNTIMNTLLLLVLIAVGSSSANYIAYITIADFYHLPTLNDTGVFLQPCVDRGDTKALDKAKNAIAAFSECFNQVDEFHEEEASENSTLIIQAFCRQSNNFQSTCVQELVNNVLPCASDSDVAALEMYQTMAVAQQNYLCSDNEHHLTRIADVIRNHAETNCSRMAIECARPIMEGLREAGPSFLNPERFLLSPTGCGLRTSRPPCVQQVLPQCQEDELAVSILGLITTTVEQIPGCAE